MKHAIKNLHKPDEVTWFDSRVTQPWKSGQYLVVKQAYMDGMILVMRFHEESEKNGIKAGFYNGHPQQESPDENILYWAFIETIKMPDLSYIIGKVETVKPVKD